MSQGRLLYFQSWRARLWDHWGHPQHRNAYYLMLNGITGAAAGVLFWLLLVRLGRLTPHEIGLGYAVIALGTTLGLLAKGGLDTALIRSIPGASRQEASRLLRFGILVGAGIALALSVTLALVAQLGPSFQDLTPNAWLLVAAVAVLLVITWLQDAFFLAEGDARFSFQRNLVFSGARILLPLPLVLLAVPHPVALAWSLALMVSAFAAYGFGRRLADRVGRSVPRREFLRSTFRNASGSAAEFLPGLLLTPLVLAIDGPVQAAYFGIAWTAASLLFLASSAISRSTLAELVRNPSAPSAGAIGRAARLHLWTVAPMAVLGALLAPLVLGIFGSDYATQGALTFVLLCISTVVVAPTYVYLAILRAHDRPAALLLFPAAMVIVLLILSPLLAAKYGIAGVALAWLLANIPVGLYAALRLRSEARGVTPLVQAPTLGRAPHAE